MMNERHDERHEARHEHIYIYRERDIYIYLFILVALGDQSLVLALSFDLHHKLIRNPLLDRINNGSNYSVDLNAHIISLTGA